MKPVLSDINTGGFRATMRVINELANWPETKQKAPFLAMLTAEYRREIAMDDPPVRSVLPALLAAEMKFYAASLACWRYLVWSRQSRLINDGPGLAVAFYPDHITVETAYFLIVHAGRVSWRQGGWTWYEDGRVRNAVFIDKRKGHVTEAIHWNTNGGFCEYKKLYGDLYHVTRYRDDGTVLETFKQDMDHCLHDWVLRFYEDGRSLSCVLKYRHGVSIPQTYASFQKLDPGAAPAGSFDGHPHGAWNEGGPC